MEIIRSETGARMSRSVVHNGVVYLAGTTGTAYESITSQTTEILSKVDDLLKNAGSDKSKLLRAEIWLDDMRYFDEMNAVLKYVRQEIRDMTGNTHISIKDDRQELFPELAN